MLGLIVRTFHRFRRSEGGNVFILFGATAIPLLLIMGGAVDFTRYNRYKAELSNAVDAGSLALARVGKTYTEEQADTFITNYVGAYNLADSKFTVNGFDVTKTENGYVVDASGTMQSLFLPVGNISNLHLGMSTMDVDITAQVVHSSNRLEVALVLDNTGSMNCADTMSGTCYDNYASPPTNSRIVAVKAAATTLVNTLMRDDLEDPDQIKIALVPFEGMVNVGVTSGPSATPANNWVAPPTWIAWNTTNSTTDFSLSTTTGYGIAKYGGVNFQKYDFGTHTAGCSSGANCKYVSPAYLFRKVDVPWGGCVEMRPSGTPNYELTDTAPDAAVPNSLFVPYFWPDEPDSSATVGGSGATRNNHGSYTYTNDYLNDLNSYASPATAQLALAKYRPNSATFASWHSATLKTQGSTAGPYLKGPNRGCPKPIVPLTRGDAAGKTTILNAISGMVAYYATGTYIPAGVMWGWHVLSPTLPFTEGIAPGDENYDKTVKAIVLFTDGDNTVNGGGIYSEANHNVSRYSAWGYIASNAPDGGTSYRLGGNTTATAESTLNSKTSTACANAKAAGIRIYSITFGTLDTATTTMMTGCATVDDDGDTLYYHAPTTSALADIFRQIGEDLSEIHLSM